MRYNRTMSNPISSRTPEGVPSHCPICDTPICIEPSQPPGDAPCPSCGTLLWFTCTSENVLVYEAQAIAPLRDRIVEIISESLGRRKEQVTFSSTFIKDIGIDSLDSIELIMALEEEFEMSISDDEVHKIKTVGDAIGYIVQHKR